MRALLLAAALASGCAARSTPYRFASPMLGQADVPPVRLPTRLPTRDDDGRRSPTGPRRPPRVATTPAPSRPRPRYAYGWQIDAQAGIRTASARGIELTVPEASAQAAEDVAAGGAARRAVWSHLPAPHRIAAGITTPVAFPRSVREAADLRALVGTRDPREPFAITRAWLTDLGLSFVATATPIEMARAVAAAPTDGASLVSWARERGALLAPTETPQPGDLLVFDRAVANEPADLVAIVVGRDERGVTSFVYPGNGVIRRGFVDVSRATVRRDLGGATVNTFLRHGSQWPPRGTKYLAGELLAHIVRLR